jgi:hypothetical protein
MTNVIQLNQFKKRQIARRCFQQLNVNFKESYNAETRIKDFSGLVLLFLANPDETSTALAYQLIQFVLLPKNQQPASTLDKKTEIDLMDIHLYLVDKVRFEIMQRLGWIESYPGCDSSVIDLIIHYEKIRYDRYNTPPQLSKHHEGYDEFMSLGDREKETFVRRFFLSALVAFEGQNKE